MRKRLKGILICLFAMICLLQISVFATNYPGGWDSTVTYNLDDTITIGGKAYTYKGDASASMLSLAGYSSSG